MLSLICVCFCIKNENLILCFSHNILEFNQVGISIYIQEELSDGRELTEQAWQIKFFSTKFENEKI